MRCRWTRTCLSSAESFSMDSEKAPAISGRLSTAGRMASHILIRSGFFAHVGNAALRMLRANRTRLDITMPSCGPLRRALSAGGIRKSFKFILGGRRRGGFGQAGIFLSGFFMPAVGLALNLVLLLL